jgi:hypothetical protein
LFNPDGLSANQFDRLQQKAFLGLNLVGGDCLDQVLEILGVDLPIESMADLLNPAAILPNSFDTLLYQGTPIYENGVLTPGIPGSIVVAPSGCDELGKIIPPNWAVANKALGFELQQISGIANLPLPELASILTA